MRELPRWAPLVGLVGSADILIVGLSCRLMSSEQRAAPSDMAVRGSRPGTLWQIAVVGVFPLLIWSGVDHLD